MFKLEKLIVEQVKVSRNAIEVTVSPDLIARRNLRFGIDCLLTGGDTQQTFTRRSSKIYFEFLQPDTEYKVNLQGFIMVDGQRINLEPVVIDVKTTNADAPDAPECLDWSDYGRYFLNVRWEHVPNCHYRVYLDGRYIDETNENRYSVDDLEPGTCYDVGVVAVDTDGNMSEMVTISLQTDEEDDDDSDYDYGNSTIRDYGYKPNPQFYGAVFGNNVLFEGLELEVDRCSDRYDNAEFVNNNLPYVYCKNDGSLNDGFEIVSHPATLDYHKQANWQKVMQVLTESGVRSHNTTTCGLHVHVNRSFFGTEYASQDLGIMKVLYFFEKFWDKIVTISRRKQDRLDNWAARYGLLDGETPDQLLHKAKRDNARYRAINLTNSDTIEFRVFRGTLKYTTFIATLEFVDAVCKYCVELTAETSLSNSWGDFVSYIDANGYEYLKNYLVERGV